MWSATYLSECHPWSATPVYELLTTVAGIQQDEPGFKTGADRAGAWESAPCGSVDASPTGDDRGVVRSRGIRGTERVYSPAPGSDRRVCLARDEEGAPRDFVGDRREVIRGLGRRSSDQLANVGQISFHIGLDPGTGMRVGLEVRRPCEADIANGLHHAREGNPAFSQVVRVVLQVKLTDAVLAQPVNLFHYIEAGLRRVPDIVIYRHRVGLRPVHDTHVIFGGDGILQAQDYPGLFGFRHDLAESVTHSVSFVRVFDGTFSEEREKEHSGPQRTSEPDGIEHPLDRLLVVLEPIIVKSVHAGPVDRKLILVAYAPVSGDRLWIVQRHFAVDNPAAEGHLNTIEANSLRERQRVRVRRELQVPVGHPDR